MRVVHHTITASAGAHGSISPQGVVSVDNGSSQSFTITPGANYHINDVVVDGISVGAVTGYTFDNITSDHTISASFATDTVSAADSGGGGSGGGGCLISAAADESLLAGEMPAVLLFLGFFFIGIEILRGKR